MNRTECPKEIRDLIVQLHQIHRSMGTVERFDELCEQIRAASHVEPAAWQAMLQEVREQHERMHAPHCLDFLQFVRLAIETPEFLSQFDRLCTSGTVRACTAIELEIDRVTGQRDERLRTLLQLLHTLWLRLPVAPRSAPSAHANDTGTAAPASR